jgi:hypothetical protein
MEVVMFRTHSVVVALASAGAITSAALSFDADPKAFVKVDPINLSLVWNGDQGDGGRGRGEVFISVWTYWPSNVECTNPQNKVIGPLGGDTEFPSGTIVEEPAGSGNYTITPAKVDVVGSLYFCEADCRVSNMLLFDVLVWDEDSNTTLLEYVAKIKESVDAAAEEAADNGIYLGPVELITTVIQVLIDLFTQSSDDALGRFNGFVEIPDPCAAAFEESLLSPVEGSGRRGRGRDGIPRATARDRAACENRQAAPEDHRRAAGQQVQRPCCHRQLDDAHRSRHGRHRPAG